MANGAGIRTGIRTTTVQDSRPATMAPSVKDRSGDPLARWLVVIPFGCLLMALVCAAALSRFISLPTTTSSKAPVEQEVENIPDVPTIYEIEGGGALLRFGPAFAR
jgi:hypothetical protein